MRHICSLAPRIGSDIVSLLILTSLALSGPACFSTNVQMHLDEPRYTEIVRDEPAKGWDGSERRNPRDREWAELTRLAEAQELGLRLSRGATSVNPVDVCFQWRIAEEHTKQKVTVSGGWKSDTALWTYLTGFPLVIASGVEAGLSTSAPSADLIDGNPNLDATYTQEDKLLSAAIMGGVGLALVATGSIALALDGHIESRTTSTKNITFAKQVACDTSGALRLTAQVDEIELDAGRHKLSYTRQEDSSLAVKVVGAAPRLLHSLKDDELTFRVVRRLTLRPADKNPKRAERTFEHSVTLKGSSEQSEATRRMLALAMLKSGLPMSRIEQLRFKAEGTKDVSKERFLLDLVGDAPIGSASTPLAKWLRSFASEHLLESDGVQLAKHVSLSLDAAIHIRCHTSTHPLMSIATPTNEVLKGKEGWGIVRLESMPANVRSKASDAWQAVLREAARGGKVFASLGEGRDTSMSTVPKESVDAWIATWLETLERSAKHASLSDKPSQAAWTLDRVAEMMKTPDTEALQAFSSALPLVEQTLRSVCVTETWKKNPGCKALKAQRDRVTKGLTQRIKQDLVGTREALIKEAMAEGDYADVYEAFPKHALAYKAKEKHAKALFDAEEFDELEECFPKHYLTKQSAKLIAADELRDSQRETLKSAELKGPSCDFTATTKDGDSLEVVNGRTDVNDDDKCDLPGFKRRGPPDDYYCELSGAYRQRDYEEGGLKAPLLEISCSGGLIQGLLREREVQSFRDVIDAVVRTDTTYHKGVPTVASVTRIESATLNLADEPTRSDFDESSDYRDAKADFAKKKRSAIKLKNLLVGKVMTATCVGKAQWRDEDNKSQTTFSTLWQFDTPWARDSDKLPAAEEPLRSSFDEKDEFRIALFDYKRSTQHLLLTSERLARLATTCPSMKEAVCRAEEAFVNDSENSCSESGACQPLFDGENWACVVGNSNHCLQSNRCLARGECTHNKEDGTCEPRSHRDCSRTEDCESDGICKWNRRDSICDEGGRPDPARGGTCRALAECACDWYNAMHDYDQSLASACMKAEARAARGEQSCGPELKKIRAWVRRNDDDTGMEIPSACY